ncbi:MAG TPA: NUDIX hydrolase [Anaerolineales bacterium]|nr:NUDIX hydrolase [Anaerolineales bacterium]
MKFEIIHQEMIYRGHAFNVRRDEVRTPNQRSMHLDIIEHVWAVTILPIDEEGRILFVRQYRHPAGMELLELPAGTVKDGETPEVCALREIREETGFAAGKLTKLGEFFLAPGYSTEYMVVYLASELKFGPLPGDPDEFITLQPISIEQAYSMARDGKVIDGKSLAGLFLAQPYIFKS